MPEPLRNRLMHAYNAFMNRDPPSFIDYGPSSSYRPYRLALGSRNDRSIINTIYNRIAVDCSDVKIEHVRLDDNNRYLETIESGLNNCLNLEANIDQTGRSFITDAVISMLDEGVIAIVPVDTSLNPKDTRSYDILSMRVGKIVQWYPYHVRVQIYNDRTGQQEEITIPKASAAIIENPFYSIMNEQNSVMKRLSRTLSLLDMADSQSTSGKLDMIIQLPYVIKTPARRAEAEKRRQDIEMQLGSSKYGIAYTDGTERITQLNRPINNNLQERVEYLTRMLYSQLGITESILDGTADEKTMLNYKSRIVEPIVSAIVDEMRRKFLTKTARSQKQSILYFSDPFKLVPIDQVTNMADTMTRNEIMSSNEVRQIIGMKPSSDPTADELRNKNLNQSNKAIESKNEGEIQNAE